MIIMLIFIPAFMCLSIWGTGVQLGHSDANTIEPLQR